jgi:UDP-glucose 4-epimerase
VKVLVTGALGHIGSRLIHGFRPEEFREVLLLDNLSTQRYSSLFNLPDGVPFRFIDQDILKADFSQLLRDVDCVIHLAALTDAANSLDKTEEVMRVNLEGTCRVAEACHQRGCRLFFPSTTSIYGVQTGVVDETCCELKPQSPYADSKLAAETILAEMKEKGLQVVIGRLGTIFGPSIGMRFHTAVNKFIWQAAMGLPLTVWRTALAQKRPYLDLDDAIGFIRLFLKKENLDQLLYNVVTVNVTVQDILDVIQNYLPNFEIQLTDARIMNQLSYEVCSNRLTSEGFTFCGDLSRGIGNTVAYLKSVCPKEMVNKG